MRERTGRGKWSSLVEIGGGFHLSVTQKKIKKETMNRALLIHRRQKGVRIAFNVSLLKKKKKKKNRICNLRLRGTIVGENELQEEWRIFRFSIFSQRVAWFKAFETRGTRRPIYIYSMINSLQRPSPWYAVLWKKFQV